MKLYQKNKLMKSILIYTITSVLLFFAPIQGLVISVGIAILMDTFCGIYRSVKIDGWGSVSSRRLSEIVSKMLLYQSCVISLFVIDKFVLHDILSMWFSVEYIMTKICTILLIFIEAVSIKENFEKATGKDVFKMLKKAFSRAQVIKKSINDLTEEK
jgi:hypothetical protein